MAKDEEDVCLVWPMDGKTRIGQLQKVGKEPNLGLVYICRRRKFPTTGVWSGSIIAAVLGMKKKPAIIAIVAGNLVAGLIVLILSYILV